MSAWEEIWKTKEGRARWLKPDPFIVSLVPRFKEYGINKVLDLGFGIGRHTIFFAKNGFNVYGIDPSKSGYEFAKKWSEQEKVEFKLELGEMSQIPFDNDFFDLIIAWNVVYHGTVDNIRKTIDEIIRCLKLDGYLLCTLISTKHEKFGRGVEIERNTFVIVEDEEKSDPHHYFDLEEIHILIGMFNLLKCEDLVQFSERDFHWHILAKL
jgi:SAM-dependent methyltransferase